MGTTSSPSPANGGTPDFTIVLRGYERTQVDMFIERLHARIDELSDTVAKSKNGTTDARDRINELERKVAEQAKQLEERAQPTLSGLGTRVEQLLRLAEEQAKEHRGESKREAEKLIAAAHLESKEVVEKARAVATAVKTAAEREAKATRDSAEREANELRNTTRREVETMRAEAERETTQLRTTTDHEVAEHRATAEREIATIRATAEREIIELRNVASREAEEKRAAASKLLTKAKEKREAELQALELELAERREKAEREEGERHDAAMAATQKLVAEAEQRAKAADTRAKEIDRAAEQRRRDSDAESNDILDKAKSYADRTVTDAKSEADQLVFEAKTHAEVTKQAAEREVAELTRQRDAVTGQLTQLREMLSGLAGLGTLPGTEQKAVEQAAEVAEDIQEAVEDVVDQEIAAAEELGFDSIWTSEAYGSDCFTPLAWWGARTERVKLGTAITQISARTPASTAMTAITLDHLSGGRVILGLGVSGPQVVEGWYSQDYSKPLARTREYVEIVRRIVARDEPVSYAGEHYAMPLPGGTGLGKPLKSIVRPLRTDIPIYLGAEGPKNVALAAEIGDGWLPMFFSPKADDFYRAALAEGFARPGARRTADDFEVVCVAPIIPGDDIEACADIMRPMLALYIGGMGARDRNFH